MHNDNSRIGVIILAAGASTRLGHPKQLLNLGGESLLRRSARVAVAFGRGHVFVVLGSEAVQCAEELHGLPVIIVNNPQWEEGMASSLRIGIGALIAVSDPVQAVIMMLCDQPLVVPETLQTLANAYADQERPAIASVHANGATGPPCLFDHSLFPDLSTLEGQYGAKQLLARLPEQSIAYIRFPEGAYDIDTPQDWELMERMNIRKLSIE